MTKSTVSKLDEYLGKRIQQLRKEHKVSAREVGEYLGLTQQQMSRYEMGENKIPAQLLLKLGLLFNTPVSWFFIDANQFVDLEPNRTLKQTRHRYLATNEQEEFHILKTAWIKLSNTQKETIFKLLDSYME